MALLFLQSKDIGLYWTFIVFKDLLFKFYSTFNVNEKSNQSGDVCNASIVNGYSIMSILGVQIFS